MLIDQIQKLYESEIRYLDEHYSASSLAAYIEELEWIEKEMATMNVSGLQHEVQLSTLEKLKQSTMNRVQRCLSPKTATERNHLLNCIKELKLQRGDNPILLTKLA